MANSKNKPVSELKWYRHIVSGLFAPYNGGMIFLKRGKYSILTFGGPDDNIGDLQEAKRKIDEYARSRTQKYLAKKTQDLNHLS